MKARFLRIILISSLVLMLVPIVAFGQQAYDIEMGESGSFQYSYIHTATGTAGMAPYYPSGTKWFNMDGFLNFSLAGDILTVNTSTLTAAGRGGTPYAGENWILSISGGTLDQSVGEGVKMGELNYDFSWAGGDDGLEHSGKFYIYNESEFGAPNSFDSSSLYLWANNWDNQNMTRQEFIDDGGNPIGLDLGSMTVVPEPISSTLFVVGAATLGFRRFRKKKNIVS